MDRSYLQGGQAPREAERLEKLKAKGAKVYLGVGKSCTRVFGVDGVPGVYHAKVLVVDSVVAFVGSGNHSNSSLANGEVTLKVTGGTVATEVYDKAWAEAQRVASF